MAVFECILDINQVLLTQTEKKYEKKLERMKIIYIFAVSK